MLTAIRSDQELCLGKRSLRDFYDPDGCSEVLCTVKKLRETQFTGVADEQIQLDLPVLVSDGLIG